VKGLVRIRTAALSGAFALASGIVCSSDDGFEKAGDAIRKPAIAIGSPNSLWVVEKVGESTSEKLASR